MSLTTRTRHGRDLIGAALLAALGVCTRAAFATAFPARPFWDFLAIVHFGVLFRDHGLAPSGWYWGELNPGLPFVLSLLYRLTPGDPVAVARSATVAASGLLPLIPFFLWRPVLAFRWRLLAGGLLALWPGQIFFSGVVALDNWVLLPAIALASFAVRRLLGADQGHPIVAGLLYAFAISIRQEMALVLLPVAIAASTAPGDGRRARKNLAFLGLTAGLGLLALGTQRYLATGRFAVTTEHGALGLFGSFVPGASAVGWIDARAYAAALEPRAPHHLFGRQTDLLRLTWAEAKRRPAFHALRMAAWVPRLALTADADNLLWSVGAPQSQSPDRRSRADQFLRRWTPRLKLELALIQGLFAATVALGLRRKNLAILTLSCVVLLKFLIHALISPVGRLVIPALALELITIPLGAAELAASSVRERLAHVAFALGTAGLLLLGVPRLANFVMRHDSPVLPGVRGFELGVDGGGTARCELTAGAVTGLGPAWASLRTIDDNPEPGQVARVSCILPAAGSGESLFLQLQDPYAQEALLRHTVERVEVDGRETLRRDMAADGGTTRLEVYASQPGEQPPPTVMIELFAANPDAGSHRGGALPLTFRFGCRPSAGPRDAAQR